VLLRVEAALRLEPQNPRLLLQRAQCLLSLGRLAEAREAARAAEQRAPAEPRLLDAIGTLLSQTGDQQRALAAYERAVRLAPAEPHFRFNRATVRRYLGDLEGAEQDYDRVISLKRDDYEAYLNRSELRTQTPERNHLRELEECLAPGLASWLSEVRLRYALAKEYEDLGEYARSFQQLTRAASLRRAHLSYDVAQDVATVEWIIEALPDPIPSSDAVPAGTAGASGTRPIFVVGLPRSGSTVVERILSSHSQVVAAGELPQFALAVVAGAQRVGGGAAATRRELVARSAQLDFAALGRDYLERVRAAGISAQCFVDKMPLNYLYCGLIHRALPGSRIVHVSRGAMASCYAMYKTLFKDGYPFSYDLTELGRYYLAYRRLMQHWEATLPGAIHHLSYERLVADQPGESRRLLEFCGLEWEEACEEFHRNPSPATSASAAQVRRPLYDTSVAQWRHYAQELQPLAQQLREAGVALE